jgi:di/tricarboxylate transporter
VKVGDTLLLEGAPEDIQKLATDVDLLDIAHPTERPYRRSHAPIALAVLLAVVGLASFDVVSIFLAGVVGVTIVLVTGCIDAEEAFEAVDGRLLAMLFGMLAVGEALMDSGAIAMIVGAVAPVMAGLPGWGVIAILFVFCQVLTELLSNNTVGVVMTPIAIGLAHTLDVDPRPLVVTVMIAASCAFSTPIGYQTHMLVMGPGGYRFLDYTRIGLPLSLLCALLACLVIPVVWPL